MKFVSKSETHVLIFTNIKGMNNHNKVQKFVACGLIWNYFSILNLIADEVKSENF